MRRIQPPASRASLVEVLAPILVAALALSAAAAAETDGDLCATGRSQSPIAISTRDAVPSSLAAPVFDYRPAGVLLWNTGHSLEVRYASSDWEPGAGASRLLLDGVAYQLVQFHFHRPGEHPIDGAVPALELHLVHADGRGNLAVVAVPFRIVKDENAALAALWQAIPAEEGESQLLADPFDAGSLLPAAAVTFRYPGSLTTPPCSEGVRWTVFAQGAGICQAQLDRYAEFFPKPYARDPQPPYGRRVLRISP
jgi:carbonic anhydrase